jgi:hypothetical protein
MTGSGDGSRFRLPCLASRASSMALRSIRKLGGLLFKTVLETARVSGDTLECMLGLGSVRAESS